MSQYCNSMLRYRENFPLENISPGIVSVYLYIGSKAAEYFQMKIVKVPVNEKKRTVNIKAMRKAITRNTVMVMAIVSLYPCLSQRMRGLQLSLAFDGQLWSNSRGSYWLS